MTTLHLMVGLPGSGKTTLAKKLEGELGALRLTPDEWHRYLFGQDAAHPDHDERHEKKLKCSSGELQHPPWREGLM
jgi:predicted kinase